LVKIVALVEGHGEVAALPILLRRIAAIVDPSARIEVSRPIRVKRQLLLKPGELERAVELAARQAGPDGRILILLDADQDCPRDLGPALLTRARQIRPDRTLRVVVAKSEYEAWFVTAVESIAGARGIAATATAPKDPESISDPKRWLSERMPAARSYRETLDQPALTQLFDLTAARRAPSFDKLWRDVVSLLVPPVPL